MEELIEKYGNDIVMLTIYIDELLPSEIADVEYLEERILTYMEIIK